MFSYEFLKVLNYLAPGLISVILVNSLVFRKKQSGLNLLIEAFIFTVINNNIAFWILDYLRYYRFRKSYINEPNITVYIIAIILPIIIALLVKYNLINKAILFSRISNKSNDMNTWIEFIKDTDQRLVIVHFQNDDRRLMGYIHRASEDIEEGLIYLNNACWIDENGQPIKIENAEILINYRNIDYIYTIAKEN